FRQHFIEAARALLHFGEDVVTGAIDDARHPIDVVGGQTFAQRLQDRDTAGHRRFKSHVHAVFLGGEEDLVAVLGDQRLVGGDDVFAVTDGGEHQFAGDVGAADQFHQDVHVRVVGDVEHIPGHPDTGNIAGGI